MTYVSRREMDERAERRGREEMFHRSPDYVRTRTSDAVSNTFARIWLELADIRGEIEEIRNGIDSSDTATDITALEARVEELEGQIG